MAVGYLRADSFCVGTGTAGSAEVGTIGNCWRNGVVKGNKGAREVV
jgi:hypothetical protein